MRYETHTTHVLPEVMNLLNDLEQRREDRRSFISKHGRVPGLHGRLDVLRGIYAWTDGEVRAKRWWSRRDRDDARKAARLLDSRADEMRARAERAMSNLVIFGHVEGPQL